MSYPVTLLIAEAFYTSGIVSRQFQTVAGDQEETAFLKLNEILTDSTIETDMIPYFTSAYNINFVAGQEKYFIPNLTELETITFFINTIRYQMSKMSRDRYFGSGRAQNVESLPFKWHSERCFGGTNLFVYFFPDQNYPVQITGLFSLQSVSVGQDLNSPISTANLGIAQVNGAGLLNAGELIVDGFDLMGTYATPSALVAYINTGVIPNVNATLMGGQFILTDRTGNSIAISTTGNQSPTNNVTFTSFSTTNGPLQQNFFAMVLDQFYINYLQYRLADRLCTAYNFIPPPGLTKQLLQYQQMISKRSSPMDLSINKISTLTGQNSINYGQVNLGHGWTTSG